MYSLSSGALRGIDFRGEHPGRVHTLPGRLHHPTLLIARGQMWPLLPDRGCETWSLSIRLENTLGLKTTPKQKQDAALSGHTSPELLKLKCAQKSPGNQTETQILIPGVTGRWSLSFCISNKLSGDTTVGWRTTQSTKR